MNLHMLDLSEVPGGDMPVYDKFFLVGILLGTVILICISLTNKKYYQTMGILYMFLGTMFFFYCLFNEEVRYWLFSVANYYSRWFNFLLFTLPLFLVVGSLVLMVCGLVLVVRGGVWVARASGVLLGFLLIILIGLQPSYGYISFFQ